MKYHQRNAFAANTLKVYVWIYYSSTPAASQQPAVVLRVRRILFASFACGGRLKHCIDFRLGRII